MLCIIFIMIFWINWYLQDFFVTFVNFFVPILTSVTKCRINLCSEMHQLVRQLCHFLDHLTCLSLARRLLYFFSILIDMGKSVLERDLFLHYCLSSWLLRRSRVFSHFIWWLLNNTSTSGLPQKSRCIFRVRKIFVNVLCYCNVQFGCIFSETTRLDRSFVVFFMMGSDKWKRWENFLCQDFHQFSFWLYERLDFDFDWLTWISHR